MVRALAKISFIPGSRTLCTSLLLVCCALSLSGCLGSTYMKPDRRTTNEQGQPQTISAAKELEEGILKAFPDLPVPATHRVDLSQSVIFTSPTQTIGKVVLRGNADPNSLFRFFEDNLTAKGWSTVNAFQSAVSSLYFAKPGRFVAIVITEDQTVYINVGPE